MVVTARTPGANVSGAAASASDVVADHPKTEANANIDATTDALQTAAPANADQVERAVRTRLSARARFFVAGLLVSLAGVATLALLANPGEQPTRLIAFFVALAAATVVLAELVITWVIRPRPHSSFDMIALAGAVLVIAGSVVENLMTTTSALNVMGIVAPALGAAVMSIGSAFSALGSSATRSDESYLFPQPIALDAEPLLGRSVHLKAGEMIPCDGRVELGSVGVDERAFNPVPTFKVREEQEIVYAGSEILSGSADIKVLSTTRDSCLGQMQSVIAPIVQESEQSLEAEDAKASRWTALTLMFLAVASAISWNERSPGYSSALMAAGVIGLIAAMCQVGEWLYGQRRALVRVWLRRGYLLARPTACRDLARVTRVECDASRLGTLAPAGSVRFDVLDDRLSAAALCDVLASLLGRAEDPTLVAAGDYCRHHALKLSLERVVDLREYAPRGICGTVHGIELSVGDEDFLVERGIMVQPTEGIGEASYGGLTGERSILVAIDDDVVARFRVETTQDSLVAEEGHPDWDSTVAIVPSSGVARELGTDTLLVRGHESDLIGQTAQLELTLFSAQDGAIRRSAVVAFTPALAPLSELLADCRRHCRALERCRLLVGFGGLVTVAAAFGGILTPVIPLAWLLFLGAAVRGASVRLSQPVG
jgi:cation transport ATPase